MTNFCVGVEEVNSWDSESVGENIKLVLVTLKRFWVPGVATFDHSRCTPFYKVWSSEELSHSAP